MTECIATSFYSSSFAKLQDHVASEDEVVFPFGSDTSSHHSLSVETEPINCWPYFVENQATGQKLECSPSPTLRPNEQGRSSYSSTVVRVERIDTNPSSSRIEPQADITSFAWANEQVDFRTDVKGTEQEEIVEPAEVVEHMHMNTLGLDLCVSHEDEDLGLTLTPGPHPFITETTPTLYYQLSSEGSSSHPSSSG